MASARGLVLLGVACLCAVAVGYFPALAAPFVADDYPLWSGLTDGSSGLAAIGMRPEVRFVRPVLGLSFALDLWWLGSDLGAHVAAMRAHNLLLHAACAWLLGVVALRWTARPVASVVAALAFASCPLHPEAVTWVSARGYPLAGCFTLAAMAVALAGKAPTSFARLALVFLLGAAALFSVEPALPLAVYPLALLWAMRGRRGFGVTLVLVFVTLAYLTCRVLWLGDLGGYRAADGTNRHAAIALGTTLTYLLEAGAHLLAPGPWDGEDGRGLTILVALVATFTLLLHGGARHVRESVRRGAALVVCMLAALSVTATWATLVGNLGGCRYLYFAAMFWCLGLGWSADLAWSAGGRRRGLMLVACAGLLAGQVVVLRAVNTRWQVGGELAQAAIDGVVERVQSHGTQHAFLFALPVGFKGAHALPWGIEAALALRVGPRLRIDVLPDAAAFERARQMHAQATPTERATIDLGAFDADARSWRWH